MQGVQVAELTGLGDEARCMQCHQGRASTQTVNASIEEAGVTDPDLLEACIVDVGYTRDESFTETAVAVQARNDPNWETDLDKRSR